MTSFEDRPLSYRLGRALFWFDGDATLRHLAAQVSEEHGDDPTEADLPNELRELLAWASKVAPQLERP